MRSYHRLLKDLHSLLAAGAPIQDALSTLASRSGDKSLAAVLLRAVVAGETLGKALGELAPRVPAEHAAMVTAGETSGKLLDVLAMILEDLEARREHRRALLSRVAYPLCIVAAAIVLPPLYLVVLGEMQAYIAYQLKFFVPLLVIAFLVWRGPRLVPRGSAARKQLERLFLSLPGLRQAVLDPVLGRTLHLLGMLMDTGLSYEESLPLAGNAAGWELVRQEMARIDGELRAGSTATQSFAKLPGLPRAALAQIARGEDEGMVGRSFLEIGEELRERHLFRLKVTLRILPVVALLAAGLMVLFQALKVFEARMP